MRNPIVARVGTLCTAMLIGAVPALADWTGQGEAGLVIASGNTETETANVKLTVQAESELWEHELRLEALYTSTDGTRTGRRWGLAHQSNLNFSEKIFGFVSGRYENDAFGGFRYQAPLSGGIGYVFIDDDRTTINIDGGVGIKLFETRDIRCAAGAVIRKDRCTDDFEPTADDITVREGVRETQTIFTLDVNIDHVLTDTTTFFDHLKMEFGEENTFIQNTIGVQLKISERLALALSYDVRNNSDPPGEFRSTDTITTANLVYEFR